MLSLVAEAQSVASKFTALKSEIQSSLPDRFMYDVAPPMTPQLAFIQSVDKTNPQQRGRLSFVSAWPTLMVAATTNVKFRSLQFSNQGEHFAYLHVAGDEPDFFNAQRERLEASLDAMLRTKKLGRLVASGRGLPASFFFDVCLTDIDKAIPVLQTFCRENQLPETTWLRFYDVKWETRMGGNAARFPRARQRIS